MFPNVLRNVLIDASLAGLLSGCFSAQCKKMGFGSEGTPENERCVYQTYQNLGQGMQQMRNPPMQNYTITCIGCR